MKCDSGPTAPAAGRSPLGGRTNIVCFGNLYGGDDGVAIHALRQLQERSLPEQVGLFEAGTGGIGALVYLDGCDRAILVDALQTGAPPGSILELAAADIPAPEAALTSHMIGVEHIVTLLSLAFPDGAPEVVVVGVEVEAIKLFSDQLSPAVAAALPALVARLESMVTACDFGDEPLR